MRLMNLILDYAHPYKISFSDSSIEVLSNTDVKVILTKNVGVNKIEYELSLSYNFQDVETIFAKYIIYSDLIVFIKDYIKSFNKYNLNLSYYRKLSSELEQLALKSNLSCRNHSSINFGDYYNCFKNKFNIVSDCSSSPELSYYLIRKFTIDFEFFNKIVKTKHTTDDFIEFLSVSRFVNYNTELSNFLGLNTLKPSDDSDIRIDSLGLPVFIVCLLTSVNKTHLNVEDANKILHKYNSCKFKS